MILPTPRGWTVHWIDDDTGERESEYIGLPKMKARKALARQIPPNGWGMDVRLARRGEKPDFVMTRGSERVGLMLI